MLADAIEVGCYANQKVIRQRRMMIAMGIIIVALIAGYFFI